MNFVIDENVSSGLAEALRKLGHNVTAITETADRGVEDSEVWEIARASLSILVTRDYHFTNPARFDPSHVKGIIYIRPGNLTSRDEIELVMRFTASFPPEVFAGKLVILSRGGVRVR